MSAVLTKWLVPVSGVPLWTTRPEELPLVWMKTPVIWSPSTSLKPKSATVKM